jgi:ligand-binding sensor domain-containing protein
LALNPDLDVSQYAHKAWTVREGFSKGEIYRIAQTPDGYLWLGTGLGLLRFDGVRAVPWQPPAGQRLPSEFILSLLAARDGTLWIGTRKGLASWKNGKLTSYPQLAGLFVFVLVEDREGSVWAGAGGSPFGRLCEIKAGSVECRGEDGIFGFGVFGLHEDRKGNLWAGVVNGLWRWKPGPAKFYPIPDKPNGIENMVETDDGDLLFAARGGVERFAGGKTQMVYPFPEPVRRFNAEKLLRDREGSLWIGTSGGGVVHVHGGKADLFRQSNGLSGDFLGQIFEDREGSIWVTTLNGLDRFSEVAVPTFSVNQGLSSGSVMTALSAQDGSVWFSTLDSLNRWNDGKFTAYRQRLGRALAGAREIGGTAVPEKGLSSLFQDGRGRIWIATRSGVGYLENNRFIVANGLPGEVVNAIAEDREGNLWFAYQHLGLFRLSRDNRVLQVPWTGLGHQDYALALAADPLQGGLWIGFTGGGIARFADGKVGASYRAADGLGEGFVDNLRFDPDDTLWVATESGLSRLKNGHVATLSRKNGLPCDAVEWQIEDDAGSFWLYTPCGLVRIARPELDAWTSNPNRSIQTSVFDNSDWSKDSRREWRLHPACRQGIGWAIVVCE